MIAIRGATIYMPSSVISGGTILIEAGRFAAVTDRPVAPQDEEIDARGLLAIPGLIDLQCNGMAGYDVLDGEPETIAGLAQAMARHGCTAFLPTLITASHAVLARGLRAIADVARESRGGATVLGSHMEGPWLSPRHKGAHPLEQIRPFDAAEWAILQAAAAGTVRLVTLAPEMPGNGDAVAALASAGLLVSVGHSSADYDATMAALAEGARLVTHLFNAMDPLRHRAPGLVGAALTEPNLVPSIIPDGYHLHPAVIRLVERARRGDELLVITDAVPVAGLPPGEYAWDGRQVTWDGDRVRLLDGTLAGSGLTPIEALRRFMRFTGRSLAEALPTMTSVPAGLLGEAGNRGAIAPGATADLVLLTPDLDVHTTIVGGRVQYRAGEDVQEPASARRH
jgi:N-acetylglucosamine-6-phosphate deacetylase